MKQQKLSPRRSNCIQVEQNQLDEFKVNDSFDGR